MSKEEKTKLVCDHCGGSGHEMSTCFKLHGVPEWYSDMKAKRTRSFANMNVFDFADAPKTEKSSEFAVSCNTCKR